MTIFSCLHRLVLDRRTIDQLHDELEMVQEYATEIGQQLRDVSAEAFILQAENERLRRRLCEVDR